MMLVQILVALKSIIAFPLFILLIAELTNERLKIAGHKVLIKRFITFNVKLCTEPTF
jgi:hypothetical protein